MLMQIKANETSNSGVSGAAPGKPRLDLGPALCCFIATGKSSFPLPGLLRRALLGPPWTFPRAASAEPHIFCLPRVLCLLLSSFSEALFYSLFTEDLEARNQSVL